MVPILFPEIERRVKEAHTHNPARALRGVLGFTPHSSCARFLVRACIFRRSNLTSLIINHYILCFLPPPPVEPVCMPSFFLLSLEPAISQHCLCLLLVLSSSCSLLLTGRAPGILARAGSLSCPRNLSRAFAGEKHSLLYTF